MLNRKCTWSEEQCRLIRRCAYVLMKIYKRVGLLFILYIFIAVFTELTLSLGSLYTGTGASYSNTAKFVQKQTGVLISEYDWEGQTKSWFNILNNIRNRAIHEISCFNTKDIFMMFMLLTMEERHCLFKAVLGDYYDAVTVSEFVVALDRHKSESMFSVVDNFISWFDSSKAA